MRSSLYFAAFLAFSAFGVLAGCAAEPKDHAPYLGGGCQTSACQVDHVTGGTPPGGDGGLTTTSDGGQGTGNLTGVVTVFRDPAFVNRIAFTGEGVITIQGSHQIIGALSGSSFTVDHTDFSKNLWVDIRATTGGTDLMETIAPVDGTATNVEVTFGRISDMTSVVASFTLTPQSMNATHAQIVLRFVSAAGAPVSGLQITQSAGAAVLYDAGSSYSDAFGATQGRGMAVLVNATASSIFPGTPVTITYKAGATLGTVDVYAVRGALTIADVLVK
jgi:hypothetical protein